LGGGVCCARAHSQTSASTLPSGTLALAALPLPWPKGVTMVRWFRAESARHRRVVGDHAAVRRQGACDRLKTGQTRARLPCLRARPDRAALFYYRPGPEGPIIKWAFCVVARFEWPTLPRPDLGSCGAIFHMAITRVQRCARSPWPPAPRRALPGPPRPPRSRRPPLLYAPAMHGSTSPCIGHFVPGADHRCPGCVTGTPLPAAPVRGASRCTTRCCE
jgi:hypothetical protein